MRAERDGLRRLILASRSDACAHEGRAVGYAIASGVVAAGLDAGDPPADGGRVGADRGGVLGVSRSSGEAVLLWTATLLAMIAATLALIRRRVLPRGRSPETEAPAAERGLQLPPAHWAKHRNDR
jgi:hypothetical protein